MNIYVKIKEIDECNNKITITKKDDKSIVIIDNNEQQEIVELLKILNTKKEIYSKYDNNGPWIIKAINVHMFNMGLENFIHNPHIFFDKTSPLFSYFVEYIDIVIKKVNMNVTNNILIEEILKIVENKMYEKTCYRCNIFSSSRSFDEYDTKDLFFSLNNLTIKEKYGFRYTFKDILVANIKYYLMDVIFKGDQWTMIHNYQMNVYNDNGFLVEVFGSPFNTRLKYFGSVFSTDEIFGRIGTFDVILDQIINTGMLKWRTNIIINKDDIVKLVISPPTSYDICLMVINKIYKIFKKRKCMIHLGIPNGIFKLYNNYKQNGIIDERINVLLKLFKITNQIIMTSYYAKELYTNDGSDGKIKKLATPWYNTLFYNTDIPNAMKSTRFTRNTKADFKYFNYN